MLKHLTPPIKALAKSARTITRRAQDSGQWLIDLSRISAQPESRNPVLPDAIPFQDPIDEICEERPPHFMRSTHHIIIGLFVVLLLMASLVKVDVVVVGSGRLTTDTPPIMLQSMNRAIIKEIKVRAGDAVTKGQVLATLDPTFTQADLATVTIQQQSLIAQVRRLEAELNDQPFVAASMASADDLLQVNLYTQRKAQYASQLRIYDEEIQRRRANIRTTEDHRDSQSKQLDIAREVEGMRAAMYKKEIGSKLNHLEAQSARMRIEQDIEDSSNRLSELKHDLQSKEAERQAFIDQWRHQVLESLINARAEASKTGEGVTKAALLNDLIVVTAPEDGIVLDVAKRSVGSIMREAELFVTIMRSGVPLVAEISINSTDVGYTRVGDEVILKVDAFPYQRHGYMEGKLLTVSEESIAATPAAGAEQDVLLPPSQSGGGAFHRGRVNLDISKKLENMPPGAKLIPGMTLTAEIKVGSRTVMSYFLNPITRVFGESIREP